MFFLDNTKSFKDISAFVAHLSSNIHDKSQLLSELKKVLNFPEYYGNNWDSLYECLNDLHWLKNKPVIIVHDDIPHLSIKELSVYLEILITSTSNWNKNNMGKLRIAFPKKDEERLKKIIEDRQKESGI